MIMSVLIQNNYIILYYYNSDDNVCLNYVSIKQVIIFRFNINMEKNLRKMYLHLLKKSLLDTLHGTQINIHVGPTITVTDYDISEGTYWPQRAYTMIGEKRLDNIKYCMKKCIEDNIQGDFIEAGVWRGGSTIYMKGILSSYGITDRKVYVADSFEGLPPPDPNKYPIDKGSQFHLIDFLRVSQETVMNNFKTYDLFDENIIFIKGFFETSLKNVNIDKLAILRLDGDLYSSTIQVLEQLYDKVSIGGFIIVDDSALIGAHTAVNDFRIKNNIVDPIIPIGEVHGTYWRKTK